MRKRLASVLATLALLPCLAQAHGPSAYGGVRHHYHSRSSVNFGISVGSGYYYPGYYSNYWVGPPVIYTPPPVYTAPPVVIQTQPPVYIERPPETAAAPAPATAYWYYCASTQSYYPYVSECPEAWLRVLPTPPAPAASTARP